MNHISTLTWILKCIESCETKAQLKGASRLVELYYKNFSNSYLYQFLKNKFIEHKKYLTYETNI